MSRQGRAPETELGAGQEQGPAAAVRCLTAPGGVAAPMAEGLPLGRTLRLGRQARGGAGRGAKEGCQGRVRGPERAARTANRRPCHPPRPVPHWRIRSRTESGSVHHRSVLVSPVLCKRPSRARSGRGSGNPSRRQNVSAVGRTCRPGGMRLCRHRPRPYHPVLSPHAPQAAPLFPRVPGEVPCKMI